LPTAASRLDQEAAALLRVRTLAFPPSRRINGPATYVKAAVPGDIPARWPRAAPPLVVDLI
jgi:hypothetical protein